MLEALWCFLARAAVIVGDQDMMQRSFTALRQAVVELAGAGSGLITLGPVSAYLDELTSHEGMKVTKAAAESSASER